MTSLTVDLRIGPNIMTALTIGLPLPISDIQLKFKIRNTLHDWIRFIKTSGKV